jgi:hypothetical protein
MADTPTICAANHYGKWLLCRVSKTLGKGPKTLGKSFAECCTWQRTHGRENVGKGNFAECISSGTRQSLCRAKSRTRQNLSAVTEQGHNGRFAECQVLDTRQRNNICRAPALRHSAKMVTLPSAKYLALGKEVVFAECQMPGARQILFLC